MKKLLLIAIVSLFAVALCVAAKEKVEAKVDCDEKFVRIRKGANMAGGSIENPPCFLSIPEEFDGRKITLRPLGFSPAKEPLVFDVKKDGIVNLVISERRSGPAFKTLMSDGWEKVANIKISWPGDRYENLIIIQKNLAQGTYTISGGGDTGVRLIL